MIGETFKNKRGAIKIVGVRDGHYIAEHLNSFAPPFTISPAELAEQYGGSPEPIAPVDENAAWLSMDRRWLDRARLDHIAAEDAAPPALAPEDQFRRAEESADD